jgi:hypothetical protein
MSDTTMPSEPIRRMGGMSRLPVLIVLALWPSFGGHWVDLAYLRWVRPRVADRRLRVVARIATWAPGGVMLAVGMLATADLFSVNMPRWPGWWLGAAALIGIELVAHLGLQARGAPSFYNGRG